MREASRFDARKIGRSRTALLLTGAVLVGALFAAVSGLGFGAGTASARSTQKIPYWNTVVTTLTHHWDDGCECYNGYDTNIMGFDRDFGMFPPDNVAKISPPPPPFGPKGTAVPAMEIVTFGSSHIKGFNEFLMASDGKSAKLKGTVMAPAGTNGATVTTHSSPGTAPMQVVTWSKNGVPIGSPVLVNIDYYLDFASLQKYACANGSLSPPFEVVPTVVNADGTTTAGRPALEPCAFKIARKITLTK
jgi:hypothetical protein